MLREGATVFCFMYTDTMTSPYIQVSRYDVLLLVTLLQ